MHEAHTHTHTHTHTYVRTSSTCMQRYMHAYMHTYIHIHIHIHAWIQASFFIFWQWKHLTGHSNNKDRLLISLDRPARERPFWRHVSTWIRRFRHVCLKGSTIIITRGQPVYPLVEQLYKLVGLGRVKQPDSTGLVWPLARVWSGTVFNPTRRQPYYGPCTKTLHAPPRHCQRRILATFCRRRLWNECSILLH